MVEILEQPNQLVVRIGGQEYTRYQYPQTAFKPFLYPIRAANGLSLVADAPTDHRHHHGIWIGHGRVNDSDFWLERHNSGHIVQQDWSTRSIDDTAIELTTHSHWIDADGVLQLKDERIFTFYDTPVESRWFDIEILLRAPANETVLLHPTNEAGIPHIRAAEGLTVKTGGALTNAEGRHNERETYRKQSPWMDNSGKLGRIECGIALFDHPENDAFPTRWFTRDYGPFSPNYGFFADDPIEISPKTPLRLRYRVYTHSGNVIDGGVAEAWKEYSKDSPYIHIPE